jgi:hypothetical protein
MLAAAAWNFRKWMRLFGLFGFASSVRFLPKTSASRRKESAENFAGPTNYDKSK